MLQTISIFLLSTRAAGVGINLATADVVLFYDISFNPTVERQAEDRVHRFGQEKGKLVSVCDLIYLDVTIFKLLMKDSVEEQMLNISKDKAKLIDVMLEEGSFEHNPDVEPELGISTKYIRKLFEEIVSNPQDT
jgi:SNF2 family DNA or RNA helicase